MEVEGRINFYWVCVVVLRVGDMSEKNKEIEKFYFYGVYVIYITYIFICIRIYNKCFKVK